jgi:hypothetical protein
MNTASIHSSAQRYRKLVVLLLIFLWAYSALDKVSDFPKFRMELGKSPLLTGWQNAVAVLVPLAELGIAVLLRIKRTTLTGLYLSFALLSLFTAYLVVILNYSYYIPCSCNGILMDMPWSIHILFNTGCLLFTASAIVITSSEPEKGGAFSVA